jgi:cell division protein FtsB
MFRLIALLLLALLVALQVKLWAGSGGLAEVRQLEQTVARQRAENEELLRRNEALAAEVDDLKRGQAAIEERARAELGMIKPGETLYRVVEPRPSTTPVDPGGQQP